jgi:metallo-beta-lactamase class B
MAMKCYPVSMFCIVLVFASWVVANANAQNVIDDTDPHVAAAKAAAYRPGQDFTGPFTQICGERLPRRMRLEDGVLVPETRASVAAPGRRIPPRSDWYQAPVKVFDNLYSVGSRNESMWVVTTSEGIILHDTAFDYMVEDQIVEGLRTLGLDPTQIKYVIIAQGHSDHYFGAKQLQDTYGARIIMSEADWDLVANDNNTAEIKPRKDMVATDGMELTLGDTTLTLYITPGHTPGTISTLIPLRDGDRWHLGSIWGGNSFGIRHFEEPLDALRTHLTSARRFQDIAARARADVYLSSHTPHDRTLEKLNALKFRNPGDPHPFVSSDAVWRHLTVISECTESALGWLTQARRDGISMRHSIESGLR